MEIFRQISKAIKYLHKRRIIHRDIKPDNIMIDKDKKIKLIDFRSCKILDEEEEKMKTWIGTPLFISPEITKNKRYDDQCDVWSLGVTLYYMLSGKYPIYAETAKDIDIDVQLKDRTKTLLKLMLNPLPEARSTINQILNYLDGENDSSITDIRQTYNKYKLYYTYCVRDHEEDKNNQNKNDKNKHKGNKNTEKINRKDKVITKKKQYNDIESDNEGEENSKEMCSTQSNGNQDKINK